MIEIAKLEWDSNFFGYNVGKLQLLPNQELDMEEFLSASKAFKLVYIYTDREIDHTACTLVDKKVTLLADTSANDLKSNIVSFDEQKHPYDQLQCLALQSGIYSRFKLDANFKNNEYIKLYTHWLAQSLKKDKALDVFVAENNVIEGFITLEEKSDSVSSIGLIAVSDLARGQGLGGELVKKTIDASFNMGYKQIQVVTQLQNEAALTLYNKFKFKITNVTNIYHYWNI